MDVPPHAPFVTPHAPRSHAVARAGLALLLPAALAACGSTSHPRSTANPVEDRAQAPEPAPGTGGVTLPPIDPAAPTALDALVGAWSCDGWLLPDDTTRAGVRIDVTRERAAAGAYAIEYRLAVSTTAGPYCVMPWAARTDEIWFPLAPGCRLAYSGRGAGAWTDDELGLWLVEDPATPKIPEQPYQPAPDPDAAVALAPPADLRIVRHGADQLRLHAFQTTVACRRI